MKIQVICGKCGKTFEAEESVRTDICPHCMSFVDLRGTGAAPAEKPAARARQKVPDAGSPMRPLQKEVTPAASAAPAPQGGTYAEACAGAESMMAAGAWSNAALLFAKGLAEKEDGWQARFGIVRAKTREFTDLSALAGVQEDAAAALRAMPAEERRAFGARYLPVLAEKRARPPSSSASASRAFCSSSAARSCPRPLPRAAPYSLRVRSRAYSASPSASAFRCGKSAPTRRRVQSQK